MTDREKALIFWSYVTRLIDDLETLRNLPKPECIEREFAMDRAKAFAEADVGACSLLALSEKSLNKLGWDQQLSPSGGWST